jgi:hypothetical protein
MDDAFISYSLQDKDWADKLESDLKKRGLSVFRDTTRLKAGIEWDKALQGALSDSRHLIVLWSDNAKNSNWVQSEIVYFDRDRENDESRLLVFVNLQGRYEPKARIEAIDLLEKAGSYANGAGNVAQTLWLEVLNRIEDAIGHNELPVYTAVLTSTLARLREIPLTHQTNFAAKYGETLEVIGIKKDATDGWKKELEKYHGETRSMWRPFAGSKFIGEILDDLRNLVKKQGAPSFRWRPIGDEFWSDDAEAVRAQADKLVGALSAIVIDPLSLYDNDVLKRLETLRLRLHGRSGVSILAPFSIPLVTQHFRTLIKNSTEDLYNQFYLVPFGNSLPRAQVSICEDHLDFGKLIGNMLLPATAKTSVHEALKT